MIYLAVAGGLVEENERKIKEMGLIFAHLPIFQCDSASHTHRSLFNTLKEG